MGEPAAVSACLITRMQPNCVWFELEEEEDDDVDDDDVDDDELEPPVCVLMNVISAQLEPGRTITFPYIGVTAEVHPPGTFSVTVCSPGAATL